MLNEAKEIICSPELQTKDVQDDIWEDASIISSISSTDLEHQEEQTHRLSSHIAPFVQDLVDLGPTIENNLVAPRQEVREVTSRGDTFSVSIPALPYVSIIRDKFPKASSKLVERLGEANRQRHILVRDRPRQRADKSQSAVETNKSAIFSQCGKVSLFHNSGIGTSISANSQRAASLTSHSSFVSTLPEDGQHRARVPPTPKEVGEGIPFKCDICHFFQGNIRNRVDWK